MNTSTSQITGTCSGNMVLGILLQPVRERISVLCSVHDFAYIKKRGIFDLTGNVANIMEHPHKTPPAIVVRVFPKVSQDARPLNIDRCRRCGTTHYVIRAECRICTFCGDSHYYESVAHQGSQSIMNARIFNHNTNKRVAHFKGWIARLQGKERCSITAAQLNEVERLIHMYPDSLSDYDRIKMALRELRLQKFYNHIYFIQRTLMGYALVEFRKINEARLLAMFLRIQEPFARLQKGRTNMISYQFLIRKFCQLLGYKIAEYIPLLKSRANLYRQDVIWKKICEELDIPFYPSV